MKAFAIHLLLFETIYYALGFTFTGGDSTKKLTPLRRPHQTKNNELTATGMRCNMHVLSVSHNDGRTTDVRRTLVEFFVRFQWGGVGGCWAGEARDGTTSSNPDHMRHCHTSR